MDSRPRSWGAMASRLLQHMWSARGGAPPPTLRLDDETGQGLAEYALILALIAVLSVTGLALLGGEVVALLTDTVGTGFQYVLDLIGV